MMQRLQKKHLIIGAIIVVLVVGGIITTIVIQSQRKDTLSGVDAPSYATVLPAGKTIADLGGWIHFTSHNDTGAVHAYNYNDSIDDIAISVTEQPLPSSFTGDVDGHVAEFAKSFDANDVVKAGDTTVYIGTNSKGPQSVIFTKNNLLILIKSEKTIKNTTWSSYVASLQ